MDFSYESVGYTKGSKTNMSSGRHLLEILTLFVSGIFVNEVVTEVISLKNQLIGWFMKMFQYANFKSKKLSERAQKKL